MPTDSQWALPGLEQPADSMNTATNIPLFSPRQIARVVISLCTLLLVACNGGSGNQELTGGAFDVFLSVETPVLTEGSDEGLTIQVNLVRSEEHGNPVQLQVSGMTESDARMVTRSFSRQTLTPGFDTSDLVLNLAIDDLPIQEQSRTFIVSADDGNHRDQATLSVTVQPTSAPDVYLLVGQSNMVGFSGDGTRETNGLDATNPRILQLNVAKNDSDGIFTSAESYTSEQVNIVLPALTAAEDPLHIPQDPNNTGKSSDYIGLGLSFAKRALEDTTANIVLVPAAWAGTAFCQNSSGTQANWNPEPTANENLGNTLLFDRAVTRTNIALRESNGVLRGILWHQGESDANGRCAPLYAENMTKLIEALRMRINVDARGPDLRQADSRIPFVAGTMSRGADERGDLTNYLPDKQLIDDVHRLTPTLAAHAALSNHDDLVPDNGFPCGNTSCIHFGAAALREMGRRYYEGMLRALSQ